MTLVPKAKKRRDAMIGCRVTKELKDAWKAYCIRLGVSETEAVEQLIIRELATEEKKP